MPLQIRRGTEAERTTMSVPLAEGELLFVTDDKRLYIGAKDNLGNPIIGGVQITGYTNEDAQDAAATMLANGTHSGIVFTYNDVANELSASVDLSAYTGNITAAAFKGSLVADDSTMLVDAVTGRIVGPVFSNVTGNLTGDVTGNVTGNLTGTVTGTTIGYHTGDVKGSIFADDSTLLVDAVAGRIVGDFFGDITLDNNTITGKGSINVTGELNIYGSSGATSITAHAITSGLESSPGWSQISVSKGTRENPIDPEAGDFLGGLLISAFIGDGPTPVGLIATELASSADTASSTPRGNLYIGVGNNAEGITKYKFRPDGVFEAQIIKAANYATTNLPLAPETGYIVFDSTSNEFKGWNGTTWVVLG